MLAVAASALAFVAYILADTTAVWDAIDSTCVDRACVGFVAGTT